MRLARLLLLVIVIFAFAIETVAQNRDRQRRELVDSTLAARYYRNKGDLDTAYISRPQTKWTVVTRLNVSGAKIESEAMDNGQHLIAEMTADYKSTISLAASYLGVSLSAALNPAKMMGKYRDYELNF